MPEQSKPQQRHGAQEDVSPGNSVKRKKCFEIAFDRLQSVALEVLEDVPELRGLVIVADWEAGQTDFPAGLVVTRPDEQVTPESVIGRQKQLLKVQLAQFEQLSQFISMGAELLNKLAEQIQRQQQQQNTVAPTEQKQQQLPRETLVE